MNRIDSRARGNAPQLLEKYKKLAHDAHLNGDRVQEEYYLQFADHYFRVLADQKQRQEESRQPRRDDRPQEGDEDAGPGESAHRETNRPTSDSGHDRAPRAEREPRDQSSPKDSKDKAEATEASDTAAKEGAEADGSIYEPADNPFVRENRGTRGLKQRKPRRRTREDDGEAEAKAEAAETVPAESTPEGNLDPAILPPAISAKETKPKKSAAKESAGDEAAEEKPKRRRTRKTAPPSDDADGTLEAVNG
jgi:hypothetical protein